MWRRGANVAWVLGLLAGPLARAEGEGCSAEAFCYYYLCQPRRLDLDLSRVAVQRESGPPSPELPGLKGEKADVKPLGMLGWWMVELPPSLRSKATISALISRWSQEGAANQDFDSWRPVVDFASPVLSTEGGKGWAVVTRHILLQRAQRQADSPPVDDRQMYDLFRKLQVRAVEPQWAGMEGAYRIDTGKRNGIDVLRVANDLNHERCPTGSTSFNLVFAEPDMIFSGTSREVPPRSRLPPNDPAFGELWGLCNAKRPDVDVDVLRAWGVTQGSGHVTTVVIDTGVDPDHPDLNLRAGFDATSDGGEGGPVRACDHHGTAVAGVIAGLINNGKGGVGVAPGSYVSSARAFVSFPPPCDGTWVSTCAWTVGALAWADRIGARVTNNSNAYGFDCGAIASKYAETSVSMLHFAAAGNAGHAGLDYPARIGESVVAVGSITPDGRRALHSNHSEDMDFWAPGESIVTTDRSGPAGASSGDFSSVYVSGTSYASAYAAGVAALLFSAKPSLSGPQALHALRLGSTIVAGEGLGDGYGLINACLALEKAGIECDMDTAQVCR